MFYLNFLKSVIFYRPPKYTPSFLPSRSLPQRFKPALFIDFANLTHNRSAFLKKDTKKLRHPSVGRVLNQCYWGQNNQSNFPLSRSLLAAAWTYNLSTFADLTRDQKILPCPSQKRHGLHKSHTALSVGRVLNQCY